MLTIGYLWEEYEKFWFFIMCHDWLNASGHSLLISFSSSCRENQPYPTSLSKFRNLRFGKKSDLLTCVKPTITKQPNPPPFYDCKIFDGAAVVHTPSTTVSTLILIAMLKTSSSHSFWIISSQVDPRVDIVWDIYKANSIKDSTREKRGNGQRKKVTGETKIPPNWKAFLQDNTKTWKGEFQTSSFPRTRK